MVFVNEEVLLYSGKYLETLVHSRVLLPRRSKGHLNKGHKGHLNPLTAQSMKKMLKATKT